MRTRLIAPLVLGFATASICPMDKNTGSALPQRPPSWVFGVVWFLLYLAIGAAWDRSPTADPWFIALVVLLNAWLVVYSCFDMRRTSVLVLTSVVAVVIGTISTLAASGESTSVYLLIPLLAWTLYAAMLNYDSVIG
jgi:translocator protein